MFFYQFRNVDSGADKKEAYWSQFPWSRKHLPGTISSEHFVMLCEEEHLESEGIGENLPDEPHIYLEWYYESCKLSKNSDNRLLYWMLKYPTRKFPVGTTEEEKLAHYELEFLLPKYPNVGKTE